MANPASYSYLPHTKIIDVSSMATVHAVSVPGYTDGSGYAFVVSCTDSAGNLMQCNGLRVSMTNLVLAKDDAAVVLVLPDGAASSVSGQSVVSGVFDGSGYPGYALMYGAEGSTTKRITGPRSIEAYHYSPFSTLAIEVGIIDPAGGSTLVLVITYWKEVIVPPNQARGLGTQTFP